jgi:putative addiction module killer protein
VVDIRYYIDVGGNSPFAEWFAELESMASARIARAIACMEQGNFSNAKGVGEGVLEYKIDFGPGYRVYFGRDGDTIVICSREARRSDSNRISIRQRRTGGTTS